MFLNELHTRNAKNVTNGSPHVQKIVSKVEKASQKGGKRGRNGPCMFFETYLHMTCKGQT